MSLNMRQEPRDKIDRPAWISVGDSLPLLKCKLIDISDSGAKLVVENVDELPNKFALLLSRHGHPRYTCRLVWWDHNAVGVQFSSGYDQSTLPRAKQ